MEDIGPKIVLMRPGTTGFDEQGRILGTLDMPLTESGTAEVVSAAAELQALDLEAVYTSPCESATETGRVLAAALGVKCKTLDNMKNVDHGLWEGLLVEEVRRKQPKVYRRWLENPETVCPPQGEMLADARERIESTLTRIHKKHKRGTICLVVPEPLAGLVRGVLRRSDPLAPSGNGAKCGSWEVIASGSGNLVEDR